MQEELVEIVVDRGVAPAPRRLQEDLVAEGPRAQPRIAASIDGDLERFVVGKDADVHALPEAPPARQPRPHREQPALDARELAGVGRRVEHLEEKSGRLHLRSERSVARRARSARRRAGDEQGRSQRCEQPRSAHGKTCSQTHRAPRKGGWQMRQVVLVP